MTRVVLLTGGNLGRVAETLEKARRMLGLRVGAEVMHSPVMASEPWGFEASDNFLNQAVVLDTALSPVDLLDEIQRIEQELGRNRDTENPAEDTSRDSASRVYQSRTLDIDILFYGDRVVHTPRLDIPHPLIARRKFVLAPLAEILPGMVHPETGETVRAMLQNLI